METKSIFDNEFTTDEILTIIKSLRKARHSEVDCLYARHFDDSEIVQSTKAKYDKLIEKVTEMMTTVVYLRIVAGTVYWTDANNGEMLIDYQNGRGTLEETIEWLKGTIFTGQAITFKIYENGTLRNLK